MEKITPMTLKETEVEEPDMQVWRGRGIIMKEWFIQRVFAKEDVGG